MHLFDSIKISYIDHMALIWSRYLQKSISIFQSHRRELWERKQMIIEKQLFHNPQLLEEQEKGVLIGVLKIVQTI